MASNTEFSPGTSPYVTKRHLAQQLDDLYEEFDDGSPTAKRKAAHEVIECLREVYGL